MGYEKFILGALGGLALAAFGYQKSQEAKLRNEEAQKLFNQCNEYIANAQKVIDEQRKQLDSLLQNIGILKKTFIEKVLPSYLQKLDKFANFDVTEEVEGSYDYKKEIKTIDELKKIIASIQKSEYEFDYLKSDQNTKLVTFAVVGLGTVATTGLFATSNSLLTGAGALSLFHVVPLALGTGFAITGFISNYNSIRNYERVVEYYQQTELLSHKVEELSKSLDGLIKYVYSVDDRLRNMALSFISFTVKFYDIYKNHNLQEGEKLDVRHLTLEERRFVKDSYILSQILYAAYNLPLFSSDGTISTNFHEKLNESIFDFTSLLKRYA